MPERGAWICGTGMMTPVGDSTAQTATSVRALVFPSAALLGFGLGFYLLALGLIAEAAVRERRVKRREKLLVLREIGP